MPPYASSPSTSHGDFVADHVVDTTAASNSRQVEIPEAFVCPITMSLMLHPLVNRAGHTFESEAILGWLKKTGHCPLTRQPMSPSNFIRDRNLEVKIKAFRQRHGIPAPNLDADPVSPAKLASGFIVTVTKDDDEAEKKSECSASPRRPRSSSLLSMIAGKVRKDRPNGHQGGNQ